MLMFYLIPILLVLIFGYRLLLWRRLPPGPWGLPILGYLPFLNSAAPHESLTLLAAKYGKIYGLYLGNIYTVVLSDADMVAAAFSKDKLTGRAPLYVTHGIMKGYGLICAEGDVWRVHRKFTSRCLRWFGAVKSVGPKTKHLQERIMKEVLECVDSIRKEGRPLEPLKHLQHGVGTVMCYMVFGKIWTKDDETWLWLQLLQETGTKAIGVAGPLNFLPFLRYVPMYNRVMNFLLEGKRKTHKLYEELIQEQRQKFDVTDLDTVPENVVQAFLRETEAAADKALFTDQQFYHLLADVFGAGLDTTLTTLRWFILYMAEKPRVQSKIQEELDQVLQKRLPTLEDMPSLPLTQAALAETQRIRSVVPVGIPHSNVDSLELFGYHIPKRSMVLPLQWAIHMDPEVWDDPNEFDVHRFLTYEMKFCKPKEFQPFQSGKRMCLGEDLANMLLFLFGATIVKRFKIAPVENEKVDLEGEVGITLTPKKQLLVFTSRL